MMISWFGVYILPVALTRLPQTDESVTEGRPPSKPLQGISCATSSTRGAAVFSLSSEDKSSVVSKGYPQLSPLICSSFLMVWLEPLVNQLELVCLFRLHACGS